MNSEQQYIELFEQCEAMICKHSAEVLNAPRTKAFADFKQQGFPTRKVEDYKYTDVSKLFAPVFACKQKYQTGTIFARYTRQSQPSTVAIWR